MYDSIKRSSQMGNERRIIIDEVNPSQFFITGHDSYGKTYRTTFDFHNPLLAVPVQGEMWIISQYNNEWRLERRVENGTETTKATDLVAGDRRIEAQNNLYLNGQKVLINGTDVKDLSSSAHVDSSIPYLNIKDFKAVGDGVTDDALAMQLALDQLGTKGGMIILPAGTWTWKSVPKITSGITGTLYITGEPGAKIQLTQNGPSAFAFNRTADHQTFQNIVISDLLIDGGATVTGANHVILGNWQNGVTQLHMNFDNITIRRVQTINVNSDGGSVASTERANVYFITAQSATAEAIQNYVTRITIKECHFSGGAHGVVIGGFNTQGNGSSGSLNTNTWCDEINIHDVQHDTGIVSTSYWPSVNFSLGAVGHNGRCTIRDCYGKNAGDPGVESDGWDYFLADNVIIEDAGVSGFLWTNFDYPRSVEQQYVWRNCHYRRTQSNTGIGWLIQNSAQATGLGHALLRDCSFYQDRAGEVPATAVQLNSSTSGPIKSVSIENLNVTHKSFSYSGSSNQQWALIQATNLYTSGTTSLRINGLRSSTTGTRSGTGHVINSLLAVGGGTVELDLNNIEWTNNITGQANDTHWAFVLGQGYTTTLHGVARRLKPISISADATPRLFYVYDASTLTITPDFRLDDFDSSNWPAGGLTFRYQTGSQNSDKMYQQGSIAFQDLTLSGTWTAFGNGTRAPGYKKLTNGLVYLTGNATNGAVNSILGVLPSGYRPLENLFFATMGDTGAGRVLITLLIDTSGNINVYDNGTGTNNYVTLSGIYFPAGE